jgi:glycosyltransferase involved in cell wall biosynthesis
MSMTNPKVTVLMPVYNGDRYLREAIDSILSQTFTDFELLLINDGSTDGSVAIIESYNDSRIRLMHNERNLGLVATLNKGIDISKGEYIARMDSDDVSLPERLVKQVRLLDEDSSCSVVAVKVIRIDSKGEELGRWKGERAASTAAEICRRLPMVCCIAHPSVMVRTAVLKKYRYNPMQRHAEDYDLWLRLCSDGHKIEKIDEPLLKYRVHVSQVTVLNRTANLGLTNIKLKVSFLIRRITRLRLSQFDARVFLGLLRDIGVFLAKLLLRPVSRQ